MLGHLNFLQMGPLVQEGLFTKTLQRSNKIIWNALQKSKVYEQKLNRLKEYGFQACTHAMAILLTELFFNHTVRF